MATLLLAIALSSLIGVSLGLLGGGGSILTLPILVYALHIEQRVAIAASLFVVGTTSAVAAIQHARAGNVVWRVAFTFAGGGMLGAFVGGRAAALVPAQTLLLGFAFIMLAATRVMWRGRPTAATKTTTSTTTPLWRIAVEAVLVGIVSGLVGAGGGFLVVPALALRAGLPTTRAVGSSLVVIALQSFAGLAGHAAHLAPTAEVVHLVGVVTAAAVAGSFVGAAFAQRVPAERLRKAFAVFVVAMALVVLAQNLAA